MSLLIKLLHPRVLSVFTFFVVCCSSDPRSQEEQLMHQLKDHPVIEVVSPGTAIGWSPRNAKVTAVKYKQSGIDLLEAYRASAESVVARYNLSYFLLLLESQEYLDAINHDLVYPEHVSEEELSVWSFELESGNEVVSEDYQGRMIAELEGRQEPYVTLAIAAAMLRSNEDKAAVQLLLNVLRDGGVWQGHAYRRLIEIANSENSSILKSTLDKPTCHGIQAAYVLAQIPEFKRESVSYMEGISQSDNKKLAQEASDYLEMLQQEELLNSDS